MEELSPGMVLMVDGIEHVIKIITTWFHTSQGHPFKYIIFEDGLVSEKLTPQSVVVAVVWLVTLDEVPVGKAFRRSAIDGRLNHFIKAAGGEIDVNCNVYSLQSNSICFLPVETEVQVLDQLRFD